jgi:hypothetical protein
MTANIKLQTLRKKTAQNGRKLNNNGTKST